MFHQSAEGIDLMREETKTELSKAIDFFLLPIKFAFSKDGLKEFIKELPGVLLLAFLCAIVIGVAGYFVQAWFT